MGIESSVRRSLRASENIRTSVPRKFGTENISKFGLVVTALWPDKPALNLAQRAGLSERGAQFYITGDREPSYEALMVVLDEMRPRKRA